MLNGVLSLGDIRDVEKLCDRIASQAIGSRIASSATVNGGPGSISGGKITGMRSGTLSEHERSDLLAFLISETWLLWQRYDDSDDGRGRKTFSGFAVPQLRCRVLDWWRKKLGRGGSPGEWGVLSTGDLDDDELERTFRSGDRDDPLARLLDFEGAVRAGGGEVSRHAAARGRGAARGAA